MKKPLLKKLVDGELSSSETLLDIGIMNAHIGIIRLAAAVERGEPFDEKSETAKSTGNTKER